MERFPVPLVDLPTELELTAQSNVYVLVPQITFTDSSGGCIFINNGVMIFTKPGVCMQTPQEDNRHDRCYHVSTDATRMFMS